MVVALVWISTAKKLIITENNVHGTSKWEHKNVENMIPPTSKLENCAASAAEGPLVAMMVAKMKVKIVAYA